MKVVLMDIKRVVPYARNPRKNQAAIANVAASIREFGFRQPIVVDSDMVINVIPFARCHVSAFISHFVQCDDANICEISLYFLALHPMGHRLVVK